MSNPTQHEVTIFDVEKAYCAAAVKALAVLTKIAEDTRLPEQLRIEAARTALQFRPS